MEPENNNAYRTSAGRSYNFTKIEVKSDQDSFFRVRFFKDCSVGQTVKVLFTKVNGIMAFGPEPLHDSPGHAHVGEKTHPGLSRINLFLD